MNINRLIKMRTELERAVLKELERRARRILFKHPTTLDEFVMGMGEAFFTYKSPSIAGLTTCDDRAYMLPVRSLLDEFRDLKITGCPMRFTAKGPKITDW